MPFVTDIKTFAALGSGVIGSGWVARALAQGLDVIAWDPALYPLLVAQVTEAAVAAHFAARAPTRVTRHLLPRLHAMNFVLDDLLDGGVNDSLNLDSHGKALAFRLLELPLQVPPELSCFLRVPRISTQETRT